MIELHHCLAARSFRALWTLEELGLPYRLHLLPFPPRMHRREYLALNPLGTVPLLVDGDTRMTESAAICQYLASRHGPTPLAVEPHEPGYGDWLNFLHQGEATLTFPQTLVLRYARFEPEERRLPQVAEAYTKWFLARLRPLEPRLAAQPWLCAGRFTVADVSVGYALRLAGFLGLEPQWGPALRDYWVRLQARPGYRQALAAEERASTEAGLSTVPAAVGGPLY